MEARSAPRAADPGRPLTLSEHVSRTLRLAGPVMAARAGMIVMITVDTAMTGQASAAQMAHYGIALAPFVFMLVIGIGFLTGTVVLTAQADGAGRRADCGRIWRAALSLAALAGCLGGAILLLGEDLLLAGGQAPSIAAGGGQALVMAGFGLPGILLYIASGFFLEGLGRPKPGMVVALSANLLNAALNWVLIEGQLGAPAMGAAGAMLATTITRWVMFAVIAIYILRLPDRAQLGIRGPLRGLAPVWAKLLRLGLPPALAIGCESGSFTAVVFFAGLLGETALAAYQAVHNVTTFVFMLAIGLGTATAIRVANAVGRKDRSGMATAGWVGLALVVTMMLATGLLIGLFETRVALIFNREPEVVAIMVLGLSVVAFLVVLDGSQAVLISALRGAGDVIVPTAIYLLSFPVVAVPSSYVLGLTLAGGVPGLLWGLVLGLICAALLLAWRFAVVSRRAVRPI